MGVALALSRKRHKQAQGKVYMKLHSVSAALLLMGATGVASAQSSDIHGGFYMGGFAGYAKYPDHATVDVGSFTLNSVEDTRNDGSWGVLGGYRFGRYFAVEAGYIDLGEGTTRLLDAAGSPLQAKLGFKVRGETLGLVGIFPFGSHWEAFAKASFLRQNVDFRLTGTQASGPFRLSSHTSGEMKLYQEAGISYRFDSNWKTSLTVSHFTNIGREEVTGQVSFHNTSLGLFYQF